MSRQYVYAFDPQTQAWSYVAELEDRSFAGGLAYSPVDDFLYTVTGARSVPAPPGEGPPAVGAAAADDGQQPRRFVTEGPHVIQLDAEGRQVRAVPLSERLPLSPRPDGLPQLAMVGERLAIVTPPPMPRDPRAPQQEPGRCYLVNPKTGEVVSSEALVPRPAVIPGFAPGEADGLWRALGSADAGEAERAVKRLVAGGDRAVAALEPRLAPPVAPPGADRVRELVGQLASSDADVRERATSDLVHAGPPVEAPLRELLTDDLSAEARVRVEQVLAEVIREPGADPAAPPPAQVRRGARALDVLARIATPAAIERLITLSADPIIGPQARTALRDFGTPRVRDVAPAERG